MKSAFFVLGVSMLLASCGDGDQAKKTPDTPAVTIKVDSPAAPIDTLKPMPKVEPAKNGAAK